MVTESFLDKLKLFIRRNLPDGSDRGTNNSFEGILDKEAKRLLKDSDFLRSIGTETRNRKILP